MAFSAETREIRNAITSAVELLEELQNEHLIAQAYGGSIDQVLSKLGDAESENEYIDNCDDVDIDVDECRRDIERTKEHLQEVISEAESALSDLDDAKDYLEV